MAIRPSNKTRKSKFLQRWSGTAYVMPSFAILLLIALIPILYTAYLSFTKYDVLSDPVWYGTANYEKLATDQKFWSAMKNTVIYTVFTVPLQIFIPMLLADVLAKTEVKWLSSFVRSVLFVPVVASLILVGTVWRYMLSGDTGFFNSVLATVGIDPINFLGDPTWAMVVVIVVSAWKNIGYFLVLFYAGVLDIPGERYEAASVDGANRIQQFFYITIPGLRPVMVLCIILSTIWSFQVFDLVYVMTGGGPGGATTTLVIAIYQQGFKLFQMGSASAIAIVLLGIIVVFSAAQKLIIKEEN
ncbi:carbohydrate ABC transporter permease [Trueperella pyogenes]|uniref:carbohydrate ABC transporter permease n=1 Tax=Trueperella pyogenes TaxID=1661 RepID=UPI0024BF571F|nr:sugar ABC transporter permease [Trueperella pyogenes]WHU58265.1 sugar ABC transporter permease [Trueperella pyogenes]